MIFSKISQAILGAGLILLMVSGCTVGPDYTPPALETPKAFKAHLPADDRPDPAVPLPESWWALLGDEALTGLIRKAAQANLDIRIAQARLRESRAAGRVAKAGYSPTIGTSGAASVQRQSENSPSFPTLPAPFPATDPESDLYRAGFDTAWEIDVFGRVTRSVEAADARLAVAQAGRDDVVRVVLAEVALNYVELRGLQKRKAVLERNIRVQKDTLAFTRNRLEAGLGSELEVSQARAQMLSTKATLPGIEAGIRLRLFQITTLLGLHPGQPLQGLLAYQDLPQVPERFFADIPSEVVRRRPDIKAAEKVLAAETADIGVATADLFPRISLLGGFGWESGASSSLLDTASQTWRLGPSIQWPLFQGGRIRANIDVQTAQAEAALARYEKAVLGVFQEVSTALADHSHERQTARSLKAAITQSRKSVELSTALYQQGLSDILTVLNTEALLLRVEDEYALSRTREWTSLIRLYKALGGGWAKV